MLNFRSRKPVVCCDGVSRRDFLRAGTLAAGAVGLSLADLARLEACGSARSRDINCILLFLVGGPSQLDTWDLKPDAPDNVRGPFRPIRTNVPGIDIGEHFPLMAGMADRYALLRSVHHTAAPIHETGQQLMQTGRLSHGNREYPHYGSVLSRLKGRAADGLPPFVLLPRPISDTGVGVSHGQGAGFLGAGHEPFVPRGDAGSPITDIDLPQGVDPARMKTPRALLEAADPAHRAFDAAARVPDAARGQAFGQLFAERAKRAFDIAREADAVRDRYGRNTFGQSCLLARRLVEHGVRFVTVNMFDTVFDTVTWDCHADGGSLATTLEDYRETLCPRFDLAYTALLDDLHQRGMLDNTLVLATGEFGRTPQLNPRGGRDHWPGVWSVLFAGAGVRGGQVIGSSDAHGAVPKDRPIAPAEVAASVYRSLGIDPASARLAGPDGDPVPLADAEPIHELFR